MCYNKKNIILDPSDPSSVWSPLPCPVCTYPCQQAQGIQPYYLHHQKHPPSSLNRALMLYCCESLAHCLPSQYLVPYLTAACRAFSIFATDSICFDSASASSFCSFSTAFSVFLVGFHFVSSSFPFLGTKASLAHL